MIIKKFDQKIADTKAKREYKKKRLIEKKAKKVGKKDRALAEGNQLMRWGEPLAVYDSTLSKVTKQEMQQFLNSRGFYQNKILITETYRGKNRKLVNLTYDIEPGPEYVIDSVEYIIADHKVKDLFLSFKADIIVKPKMKIRQSDLSAERDRIYELMVNNGYYAFTKDLVRFEIDSVTLPQTHLIVRQIISNPPSEFEHKLYTVDSVIFVTDAGGEITRGIPNEHFKKITYTYGRFKYSPRILDWHNQIQPGKIYQRNDVIETQRQLSYLDNFKFINVKFDTLDGKFIGHIFTSPADRFQSSTELGFISVAQGYPGPFASINLRNRNLFRGLEITELNSQFKIQGVPGVAETTSRYSSIQYGSEIAITFPQFLSPLGKYYKKKISEFNPRTRFALAFNNEDRLSEYKRTTLKTNMSYVWKVKDHVSYTLTPADVSFIKSNARQSFIDTLSQFSPSYANTFKSAFVSSMSFQAIINNNYGQSNNSSYRLFSVETGGYLPLLISEQPFGDGLQYFQYTKFNVDLRQTFYIHRNQSIATRFNVGVALPRENALPYEKYYFAGGSNSIRAWNPRRLGPGAYVEYNSNGDIKYERERPGDMIMESSIELRQKLGKTGFINLAFFIDAGNVWLIRSETVDATSLQPNQNGVFQFNRFPSEIAIGAGYGLRFDMSFLIFRLDFGYKVVDPAQPPGQRWVAGKNEIINFGSKFPWVYLNPFNSKTAINIGIGFPF